MEGNARTEASGGAHPTRIAWLVTFVVPLVLLALLLAVKPAHAATFASPSSPFASAEEIELDEGEDEVEAGDEGECEEAQEELEEGEIGEEELTAICEAERRERKSAAAAGILPAACVVRSFDSSAVVDPDEDTLDLTVRYTTFEPTSAKISFGPRIDTVRRHLGAHGTVRLHRHVADGPMKKLAATHELAVQIEIPSTPPSCKHYYLDTAKLHLR